MNGAPETFGLWRVSGRRIYRGHEPGEEFPAALPNAAARRAIARGDLELVETLTPELPAERQLPEGWTA